MKKYLKPLQVNYMKPFNALKAMLWKEVKEIKRDRKLLISTILLPLISLPAIGILTALLLYYQPIFIAVVNQDVEEETNKWFVDNLISDLSSRGYKVETVQELDAALRNLTFDLIIKIPLGFSENLTSLNKVAYVEIIKRAGVSGDRVDRAEQDVKNIIASISNAVSELKIKDLAGRAGLIDVNVDAIRNPVQVKIPIYIGPSGEPAKIEDIVKPFIARLLILSFTFIVTPASTFIVDGIVGERERKTIEMLLSSPAGLWDLLVTKLVSSSLIGLIASLADIIGLLLYYGILVTALGGWFMAVFDPGLIILHAFTAFLTILVTVSISLPFITRTKGIRTASNIASMFSIIGLAFFVAGWIIDFYKLPENILNPLLLVPYTHSVLVIQSYVYRDYSRSLGSISVLIVLSLIIMVVSLKTLDREKVLLAT
ncbi:MAG: ABC transporter permease [Desulfurococcaceae archaeon]